jgi:hypothetical protein
MAKKIVNPALFIGLGGTGHKVLLNVKKAILNNYGEIPPMINLLCFDTDKKELLSASEEIEYDKKNPDGSYTRTTEDIKFNPNETIGINISNPQSLANQDYIAKWLSPSIKSQIGPSDTGAKQIGQMGRFAIFENYSKQNIERQIIEKINGLKSIEQKKNQDYEIIGDPYIHLVFSPCGGTGAGTFIDIVTIIRSADPSIQVFGYMTMPDFYTGFPMTNRVVQNAYSSLIEIDHLMGQDADPTLNKNWSNYPKSPFVVDYTGNGKKSTLPGGFFGFFNYLYLFDNIDENGKYIERVSDVYDRIGRILYLMVSGPGRDMQTSYSNNDDYLEPSSKSTNYKRRNYSSMGISQIILDREFLKNLKKTQISLEILNNYCFNNSEINSEDFSLFIDSNSWREDGGQDMVIDTLMPRNQLRYTTDALYTRFRKGSNVELKSNVDTFLRTWDERINTNTSTNKDTIFEDFTNKFKTEITKILKSKGGVSTSKQFINHMIGSFQGMSDEMQNEANTHKSNKEKFLKDLPSYLEAVLSEENGFNPVGREGRIKAASESYVQSAEKILLENWNMVRKEKAKLFFDMSLGLIKENQKKVVQLEQILAETTSDLIRERDKILKNSNNSEKDFERYIHEFYKEILNAKKEDINLEEAFKEIDFSKLINLNSIKDIKLLLNDYIINTSALKEVDKLKVEEILRSLDKEKRDNIVSYLDASSAVCIDVDYSFTLTTEREKMQKFGYICVEDKDDTIFKKNSELYNLLSTEGGYVSDNLKTFTTNDPDRITMIKIAGMFPACAIKRIESYKAKFKSASATSFYFSDIYFDKNAMDLIEGGDNEGEGLKWFTVGSALGKIYLDKAALKIELEDGQKVPIFDGDREKTNRHLASKSFIENKEWVLYIQKCFNTFSDVNGLTAVTEKFVNFYKNITTVEVLGKQFEKMDQTKDEYKNIFIERKGLKEFATALTIRPDNFD